MVLPTSIEGLTCSLAIRHQFKCEPHVQIDICQRVESLVGGKDRPCHFEVLDRFCVPGIEGRGPVEEAIVAVELTPFPVYRGGPEEEPIRSICFRDAELVVVLLIDLKRFSNAPLGGSRNVINPKRATEGQNGGIDGGDTTIKKKRI